MAIRRIVCLLAIGLTLAALAVHAAGEPAAATVSRSSAVPVAQIDLGGLFGDENEPDENEGGSAGKSQSRFAGSLPALLLILVFGLVAGGLLVMLTRRVVARVRRLGHALSRERR